MDGRFNAAEKALEFVKSGMVVGLGSGKTSEIFIKLLGKKVKGNKMRIVCVPTSVRTEKVAKKAGLVVRKLNEVKEVDLAVDGADQVDMRLNLIKGYGGALLREKIVDYGAKRFIVIVDESKLRGELSGWVPLEVSPFAVEQVRRELKKLGMEEKIRMKKGRKFITDNWNVIIDACFVKINNPKSVDVFLRSIPGVIETGIFSEKVSVVIVGSKAGVKLLS